MVKIKPMQFFKTLLNTHTVVSFLHKKMVKEESKKELFNSFMEEYSELLETVTLDPNKSVLAWVKKDIPELIITAEENMEELPLVLINQNLVMMCTVLEIFLLHVVDSILKAEPMTLLTVASEKEIKLDEVIKAKDKEEIVKKCREKVKDHFSRQGIKEKFKIIEKIGVEEKDVFNFSILRTEPQQDFSGYDLQNLADVFQKRHDIVHEAMLPIQDPVELDSILNLFIMFIFGLTWAVIKKFDIASDIDDYP